MRRKCSSRVSGLVFALACLVGLPALGWSQEEEADAAVGGKSAEEEQEEQEESALETGPSVRRKVLYRSTRLELAPMVGTTTSGAYLRDVVTGVNLNYYLTNAVGIGLVGGYSPLHLETDLARNVKSSLESNDSERLENLQFSFLQWLAGVEFKFVPIFGKFSLMNSSVAHYDVHLMGGMTMIGRGVCEANSVGESCSGNTVSGGETEFNTGMIPAGTIGAGFRLFFGDAYALNLQARTHLYRRAEASTGNADPEFSSNMFVNLGFSMFFPQTVKISR